MHSLLLKAKEESKGLKSSEKIGSGGIIFVVWGFFCTLSHLVVFAGLATGTELAQGKRKDLILLFCNMERVVIWNCSIMPTVAEHIHDLPEDSI